MMARIACLDCDCEAVGIAKAIKAGWTRISLDGPRSDAEPGIWWTHTGYCRKCNPGEGDLLEFDESSLFAESTPCP